MYTQIKYCNKRLLQKEEKDVMFIATSFDNFGCDTPYFCKSWRETQRVTPDRVALASAVEHEFELLTGMHIYSRYTYIYIYLHGALGV